MVTYKRYSSPQGDFRLEYPKSWQVAVVDHGVQFIAPARDAYVHVIYRSVQAPLSRSGLVAYALANLRRLFGTTFTQQRQVAQSDGSVRIDFGFNGRPWPGLGSAFVEQHGTTAYLFILAVQRGRSSSYDRIFEQIVGTYRVTQR